jgi:hypothetical protein
MEALQAKCWQPTTHSFPKGQKVQIKVSYAVFIAQKDSTVSQAVSFGLLPQRLGLIQKHSMRGLWWTNMTLNFSIVLLFSHC